MSVCSFKTLSKCVFMGSWSQIRWWCILLSMISGLLEVDESSVWWEDLLSHGIVPGFDVVLATAISDESDEGVSRTKVFLQFRDHHEVSDLLVLEWFLSSFERAVSGM